MAMARDKRIQFILYNLYKFGGLGIYIKYHWMLSKNIKVQDKMLYLFIDNNIYMLTSHNNFSYSF